MIKEERDSNLLSTEIVEIQIGKIGLLRRNPRKKNPWEKRKTTNPMLGIQIIPHVQRFPS
jgi:hypothetical protein